jgi:hypothetical protein
VSLALAHKAKPKTGEDEESDPMLMILDHARFVLVKYMSKGRQFF